MIGDGNGHHSLSFDGRRNVIATRMSRRNWIADVAKGDPLSDKGSPFILSTVTLRTVKGHPLHRASQLPDFLAVSSSPYNLITA
ncbi:MAG: hypothetical protein IJY03_10760 [Prevotella sp.]|nr:hypothetical protein [Prevotella sp.]